MSGRRGAAKRIKTAPEAAAALGVSERQFWRWKGAAWWPANGETDQGYDIEAIRKARPAGDVEKTKAKGDFATYKLQEQRFKADQSRTDAQLKRIKRREKEGELVPRHSHELHWSQILTELGDWCDQLPDLIVLQVPKKYQGPLRQFMTEELNKRRIATADKLKAIAREYDEKKAVEEGDS